MMKFVRKSVNLIMMLQRVEQPSPSSSLGPSIPSSLATPFPFSPPLLFTTLSPPDTPITGLPMIHNQQIKLPQLLAWFNVAQLLSNLNLANLYYHEQYYNIARGLGWSWAQANCRSSDKQHKLLYLVPPTPKQNSHEWHLHKLQLLNFVNIMNIIIMYREYSMYLKISSY